MKIVITGSCGFIGKKLHSLLPEAMGIDIIEGKNILSCDLPKADVIFHLAAQTSVEESWNDPIHDADNLKMTTRIVKNYPDSKIIFAQSAAIIGEIESPYAFSKKASGEYIKQFHNNYVICVFPNVFGGGKGVVDTFKGKQEVTIFGDGQQTRDFVHVDDIVRGLIMAQQWEKGEYFMGSGKSINILSLSKGKTVNFAPARKEIRESIVPNTTPNWIPMIDVFNYIYEKD